MSQGTKEVNSLTAKVADLKDDKKALQARIKSLETALEQAEQVSRIKSEYLENLNHEMRTSMNSIVGMTSLVRDTVNPDQAHYLEMVTTSVERLLEVVSEVLDFAKIEAGQLELEPRDFHLKQSLDHDLYLLKLAADQQGLNLSCTIDPDVPDYVNGDPKRLVQVLTNMVRNGISHTDKGEVSIHVQNSGYDDNNRLCLHFRVHDTGKGITLEKQKKLYQSFNQGNKRSMISSGGAKIGLTICSQLVKMMEGEIGLASSSRGSEFWFDIPFKEVADFELISGGKRLSAKVQQDTATYALKEARVLLAEDDSINRMLTEALLKQAGMVVSCVENGQQAVQEAVAGDFAVILMDVQMPDMDGLEATRRIRARESDSRRTPVIALTALAKQGDREKCLQAGMDDYLPKPIDKNQLLEMLTKYLTNSALVVDSDLQSQQAMVRSLVESGWHVTIAETGRAVMYEASLNQYDLILLDAHTTQMDTMEVARLIRKLEKYTGEHAVIVGVGKSNQKQSCLENGIDDYIIRPVTEDKLQQKIDQLCP